MRKLVYIYFRMLKIILKIINLLREFAENQNLLQFSPITEVLLQHAENENFYKFLQNRSFKICCVLQTIYSKTDLNDVSKKIANSPNFINPFGPNALFLYLLKTSENLSGFSCFQRVKKEYIESKWVNWCIKPYICAELN